ncbi:MAG: lipoyl(octanoyl) transferase LipB [Deltaproteobacteria bacterium]|nr:lipoyl(octanoyl) transferase LipB [Deltaproteobacteria bacterium]
MSIRQLRIERMGRVAYLPMLALQEARHQEVYAGFGPETLFLLEHYPVITLGKNAKRENVLYSEVELKQKEVELIATGRGGDVTYHGPGQIVGYFILTLGQGEQDIKGYVNRIEEILLRTLADFNIKAARTEGKRGVWVQNKKIGAIGVRVSRWVTMHGFALNITTDLKAFDLIVPCGLHDCGVTSFAQLGCMASIHKVEDRLIVNSGAVLGRNPYEASASALPQFYSSNQKIIVNNFINGTYHE